MAKAATLQPAHAPSSLRRYIPAILLGAALLLILYNVFVQPIGAFPADWNIHLRDPLDAFKKWVVGNRATSPVFVYVFEPISAFVDFVIRRSEAFLLWLPWPVIVASFFLLGNKFGGLRLGLLTTLCLLFMGLTGLWDASMQTLALMVAAVLISLAIGIPLGVWTARSNRAEAVLRPILDGMQTMPAFVYLIPVVLFFGIGRVPGRDCRRHLRRAAGRAPDQPGAPPGAGRCDRGRGGLRVDAAGSRWSRSRSRRRCRRS